MKVYLYVTVFISLIGCVKFDKPQPIDTVSLNSIPSRYHGTWSGGNYKDSIVISHHYILMSETSIKKFTKEEIDTTANYQFTENKFYDFTNLDSYSGFLYEFKNDTFYVKESKITKFDIGNRFHVSTIEDYLIVNINEEGTFWITLWIELNNENTLLFRTLKDKDLVSIKDKNKLNYLLKRDGVRYFEANLKSKDILKIINQGGFSDTLIEVPHKCRVK